MKWSQIILDVGLLYVKIALLFWAYFGFKSYTAEKRSSLTPSLKEQSIRYLAAIAVITVIGFFASHLRNLAGSEDDFDIFRADYGKGAEVFLALLPPVLFGVAEGFRTRKHE
jgi:hypothetical protein